MVDEPELLDALRAIVTPGLYAAALEDSALIDLPVVRTRAGHAASPSRRSQVFIAALEEAVDGELRGPDRQAARILFAMGDRAGRPARDRHHEVAKLRNPHWTWERNYRKDPLSRDLTTVLRALGRLKTGAALPAGDLSAGLMARIGRRRTAYPLDMSLEQLHRTGLYVEPRLVAYHERGSGRPTYSLTEMVETLAGGGSVLLLGDPGSGKSLALYEAGRRLAQRGLPPLPVRARDLHAVLDAGQASSVLLVDGLDEALEPVGDRPSTLDLLTCVPANRPRLFTSRLRDYENRYPRMLHDLEIDEVYLLDPWTVETDFKEYLRRLVAADLIDEPRLYEAVVASEQLSRLVARPLYARMLTFIGERPALNVTDPAALYGEYLTKLADTAESDTTGTGGRALAVWQEAAWTVYASGYQAGDTILMSELRTPRDVVRRRLLDHLIDTRNVHGQELGEFLHYSFYEYLVAKQIGDLLAGSADAREVADTLNQDLPRDIRHHLVGRLRLAPPRGLKDRLLAIYATTERTSEPGTRRRLVARNLLIYLLSRLVPASEEPLSALLADETDTFLRESILWALCHRGSAAALAAFFASAEAEPRWRSECRGYVLYYYGDLPRDAGPPYLDDLPYRPCTNSYRRVVDMFGRPAFLAEVPAERQSVDLYTFLDLLLVRARPVPAADLVTLDNLIEVLRGRAVAANIMARLQEMRISLTHQK